MCVSGVQKQNTRIKVPESRIKCDKDRSGGEAHPGIPKIEQEGKTAGNDRQI